MFNGHTNWETWVVSQYFFGDGESTVLAFNDMAQGDRETFKQLCDDFVSETIEMEKANLHEIVYTMRVGFWQSVDFDDLADTHFVENVESEEEDYE